MLKPTTATLVATAVLLFGWGCASTAPVTHAGPTRIDDRYLVDPRTGFAKIPSPAIERRFATAWQAFEAGDVEAARTAFSSIETKDNYPPARLALAAIALHDDRLDEAETILNRVETDGGGPDTATRVYRAELAIARKQTRAALDLYRHVVAANGPDVSRTRLAELERTLFDESYSRALSAPADTATVLLREALEVMPSSEPARLLLVQKEVAAKSYDQARSDLEPLLSGSNPDRAEIQEALAEIDAGHNRYHEAIIRYERLVHRSPEPRYTRRLDELKERWTSANMPMVYQKALESSQITRADLAVLMYWQVAAIRFSQNLASPPIAVDIDVPGRDEIIRAMALGLFPVDPVTRRVNPGAAVTAGGLNRLAARILVIRGAACVKTAAADSTDAGRALKTLTACGIAPAGADVDDEVSGRVARDLLDRVNTVISSSERGK